MPPSDKKAVAKVSKEGCIHSLRDHLITTSELALQMSRMFDVVCWLRCAQLWHEIRNSK